MKEMRRKRWWKNKCKRGWFRPV